MYNGTKNAILIYLKQKKKKKTHNIVDKKKLDIHINSLNMSIRILQ